MKKIVGYSILHCLSLLRWVDYSTAGVSCRAAEGSSGSCEKLDPSHWCENGRGIGCSLAAGQEPESGIVHRSCLNSNNCGRGTPTVNSPPRNLTVVAIPSSWDRHRVDVLVQWERPEDAVSSGYEVVVYRGLSSAVNCTCLEENADHVMLRDIKTRTSANITLEVRSLPYDSWSKAQQQTASAIVKLPTSFPPPKCWASASNKQHCQSPNFTMPYEMLDKSIVEVESRYDTGSSHLMQVQLMWGARQGSGIVIALNSHTYQDTGFLPCTSPNRTMPCFIARETSAVLLEGLDSSLNYSVNIYEFNSTLCPGFSPTHLFGGCGHVCCDGAIPILSPRYATPTTTIITTATTAPTITSQASTIIQSESLTGLQFSGSGDHLPTDDLTALSDRAHTYIFDDLLPNSNRTVISLDQLMPTAYDDTLPYTTSMYPLPTASTVTYVAMPTVDPQDTMHSSSSVPNATSLHSRPITSNMAVVQKNYLVETVCLVVVGVVLVGTVCLVLLLVLMRKKMVACSKHSLKSRKDMKRKEHVPEDRGSIILKEYLTSDRPLLASSSSSSATPSPLPANEAMSLHHFTTSPALPPYTASRSFTRHCSEPTICSSSQPQTCATMTDPHASPCTGQVVPHPPQLTTPHTLNLSIQSHSSRQAADTTPTTPPDMLAGSVLIIYSPSISNDKREKILKHLVAGLTQYGIPAHCHDTAFIKSPCQWMEQEIQKAHAVLCVCNEDFNREWDEGPARGKIPVVGLLKHLVHAMLSRGESLAKFATVLLDANDAHWIPSLYLQGDPRLLLVTEVEDIARFIRNVPTYAPPPTTSL